MSDSAIKAPAGVRGVRHRAGFSISGPFSVIEVAGGDRSRFLQNQLPADVAALDPGSGVYTAYLDPKGRVSHDLVLLSLEDRFWGVLYRELAASFLEKLDRYHIRESVTLGDRSGDLAVIELHGPESPAVLARLGGGPFELESFRHRSFEVEGLDVRFVSDPWTGDIGGHLVVVRAAVPKLERAVLEAGRDVGIVRIGEEDLEILRVEGGRLRMGVDIDERTLLPEVDRPEMVSHEKGCYLGQETVARIHSRGHVNRVFRGVVIEGAEVPGPGSLLMAEETPVGETRSAVFSPSLGQPVALARVRTHVAAPGTVLYVKTPDGLTAARVTELPAYRPPGPAEQAERLYRDGLGAFKEDRLEDALRLFERALLMNPGRSDVQESAGVCLERLGRLEEAEEAMRSLTETDPENVMAWTNLSRYLAQKGEIEEAEKLKGHVTYLVWKREAGEKAANRRAEEDAAARRARLTGRIELFEQVLALDAEDVVANFGLGKVYYDLERYEEALPFFQKAIENQKHYSMAYNHLGTALASLGRLEEARRAFREGIAAATEKGDLVPGRDMTRKLRDLESEENGESKEP